MPSINEIQRSWCNLQNMVGNLRICAFLPIRAVIFSISGAMMVSRRGKKLHILSLLAMAPFLLLGCGEGKSSDEVPARTMIVFAYLDASKVQTIELYERDRMLLVADDGFSVVSDYASGVEFETSYTRGLLFKDVPFESLTTVRVAGPDQSVELDVSSLEWQSRGAGRTHEGFQYSASYVTVLDSRSKPLFP